MDKIACRKAAVAAGLLLLLAGCGSAAATAGPGKTGTETFKGSTSDMTVIDGKADALPVTATGLVADTGSIDLAESTKTATIKLGGGAIKVAHSQGNSHQHISKACTITFTNRGTYTITGGTGKYAHAAGHGTSTIIFTGVVPKKSDGTCNTISGKVTGGHETFLAQGPLTLSQ
jgi:hypothetical protein